MQWLPLLSILSIASSCTLPDASDLGLHQIKYLLGQDTQRGSIYAQCNPMDQLTCHEHSGRADTVDPVVECSILQNAQQRRRLGVLLMQGQAAWPNGAMCYRPPTAILLPEELTIFNQAIQEFKIKTSLRVLTLEECVLQPDAISICGACQNALTVSRTAGCSSFIGYTAEVNQDISFTADCFFDRPDQPGSDPIVRVPSPNSILHGLGHAAGLHHEHQHPARTALVIPALLTNAPENYVKIPDAGTTVYDLFSIMHFSLGQDMCLPLPEFSATRFCDVNEPIGTEGCIQATEAHCDRTNPGQAIVGGGTSLSVGDIGALASLYPVNTYPAITAAPAVVAAIPTPCPSSVAAAAAVVDPNYCSGQ